MEDGGSIDTSATPRTAHTKTDHGGMPWGVGTPTHALWMHVRAQEAAIDMPCPPGRTTPHGVPCHHCNKYYGGLLRGGCRNGLT